MAVPAAYSALKYRACAACPFSQAELRKQEELRQRCKEFFTDDEDFRTYLDEKLDKGFERAIQQNCPLYVLVDVDIYDWYLVGKDQDRARLRWYEGLRDYEDFDVCTVNIDVSAIPGNERERAAEMCHLIEDYLTELGWRIEHCGKDRNEHVFLYSSWSDTCLGTYVGFRLCYEE